MAKASLKRLVSIPLGSPKIEEVSSSTTPASTDILFSFVVTGGKVLEHGQVIVTCRVRGVWKLFSGSTLRASGRTGAGFPDSSFVWIRSEQESAGSTIKLEFTQATEVSVSADIEAYYQGSEI